MITTDHEVPQDAPQPRRPPEKQAVLDRLNALVKRAKAEPALEPIATELLDLDEAARRLKNAYGLGVRHGRFDESDARAVDMMLKKIERRAYEIAERHA